LWGSAGPGLPIFITIGPAAGALSPKMSDKTKLATIISVVLPMVFFIIFILLFGFYENHVANSTIQKYLALFVLHTTSLFGWLFLPSKV
jgi:hypothetical protein